jgi:hypothetical protein
MIVTISRFPYRFGASCLLAVSNVIPTINNLHRTTLLPKLVGATNHDIGCAILIEFKHPTIGKP